MTNLPKVVPLYLAIPAKAGIQGIKQISNKNFAIGRISVSLVRANGTLALPRI